MPTVRSCTRCTGCCACCRDETTRAGRKQGMRRLAWLVLLIPAVAHGQGAPDALRELATRRAAELAAPAILTPDDLIPAFGECARPGRVERAQLRRRVR